MYCKVLLLSDAQPLSELDIPKSSYPELVNTKKVKGGDLDHPGSSGG